MKRREFIKGSAIVGATLASNSIVGKGSGLIASPDSRKVHRILDMQRTMVGTLPILRGFAGDQQDYVSPFVLFDEFGPVSLTAGSDPLRVDAHPHAGIIPTTYFLSGTGHHKDSLNYDFQIGKGDLMLFSSGKGAIHMEETGQKMFDDGGLYHGFQIWLNMPARYKFIDPSTTVYREDNMDVIQHESYTAKIVLGELLEAKSTVELLSPAFYFHIKMNAGCRLDVPTDPSHNAFLYLINGGLELANGKSMKSNQLVLFERGESVINLFANDGAELLILGGEPLNEPVFSYGPFVMNTEEQIHRCIVDYNSGKMGDPNVVNR